jgi:DGQHR domain-containing protein
MSKKYNYPCVVLAKPKLWNFRLVQFYAEASDLKRWCGVYRKEVNQKGYQRILKKPHFEQIKKYLNNPKNVIPNSVVIAFNDELDIDGDVGAGAFLEDLKAEHPVNPEGLIDDETELGLGRIQIRVHPDCDTDEALDEVKVSDKRSAFIIDGQHRISGGSASSEDTYFPVTAFVGGSKEDQAFHFIVINRKAQKVSKHDIDAVIPKNIYESLQERLAHASINNSDADIVYALDNLDDSPFKGKILWANNTDKNAPINKGAIDKLIVASRRLPQEMLDAFGDDIYEVIRAIWSGVNKHLGPLWTSKEYAKSEAEHYENQFLRKAVGVIPAIQLAINRIAEVGTINADGEDPKTQLEDTVYKWIKNVPLELFYCKWEPKSITNDTRINELRENIVKAARKKAVPYGMEGSGWFSPPESKEVALAKVSAAKKQKAAERKAQRAKKSKRKVHKKQKKAV